MNLNCLWSLPAKDTFGIDVITRRLRKGWYAKVTCKALVAEGLGVSHIDPAGFPWPVKPQTGFILGILPNETGVVRIENVRSGSFHGVLAFNHEVPAELKFLSQHDEYALCNISADREQAICPNFLRCGGCKLLHISYEETLRCKVQWFLTHLEREKILEPNLSLKNIKVIPAKNKYHYRNHVQVQINGRAERGFFAPYSYRTQQFPDSGCFLFDNQSLDKFFPSELALERCVRIRYDPETSMSGFWSYNSPKDKAATFAYTVKWPADTSTKVEIPNTAFFQVNLEMIPVWLSLIESHVHFLTKRINKKKLRILELFCGSGFISKMLAYQNNIDVIGIDILNKKQLKSVSFSNSALNPSKNGDSPISETFNKNFISWDLKKWESMPPEYRRKIDLFKSDLLLLNPARAGFSLVGLKDLLQNSSKKPMGIIYSSCNAATLARDLKAIVDCNYEIAKTTVLDFFPWTSHYEIVVFALLRR